ncbi:glycosyltransferase BC10-like isoform X2 [Miscanthus floridulus]|uniref:glycosyltransferase BC10-like isoform X2 n=1 Tax=Miscanthus floridulus TaxID=154761 RepID=UPI0034591CA6
MKWYQVWKLGFGDMKGVTVPRTRASPRRRIWISVVVIFVAITVLWAYLYPPQDYTYPVRDWFPSEPTRELTDAETAARVVFRQILSTPPFISRNPKIAFMFLTPGKLPFEKLWELFFKVGWGMITMVDAERRLLAKALEDIDNQHFVLLSDSCVPLHNFDYVYDFLMGSRHSFLDCFHDPGPHGVYRYSKNMLPEVRESEFRKGSQWFSMKRQHAMVVIADSLYYSKFRLYCRPGMEEGRNCYADEHYLPTLFHMMDPAGIANWSVTYVDWSEGKWHPRSFRAKDVTYERLKNMTSIDVSYHITSDEKKELLQRPCLWNGLKRPCYLFARKFYPEALDNLVNLFSNYYNFLSSTVGSIHIFGSIGVHVLCRLVEGQIY